MISIAACSAHNILGATTDNDAMEYCKEVALGLGLTLGKGSTQFAKESYKTKGCYYYRNRGSDTSWWAGSAFFGLGGHRDDWKGKGTLETNTWVRIPVDFKTCRIMERVG